MKNIKKIFMVVTLAVLCYSLSVMAASNNHIQNYVPDDLMWKWYGNDWSTGKLPRVTVDDSLEEGKDYTRSWAFTRELVGDVSELNYLSYEDAIKEEQLPGSVCEKITGLGEYTSEKVVCHIVYGYTYIKVNDAEKYEGEDDPEFTYKVFNYNNLPDDIGSYFDITIKRVENEELGEYELIPEFSLKNSNNIVYSFTNDVKRGSIQYLFKDLGRIIVEPIKGKLTIKAKESTDEVFEEITNEKEEDKYVPIPHTDICLNN